MVLSILGRLDSETLADLWRDAMRMADGARAGELVVDASGVDYCDGGGAALLVALEQRQRESGGRFAVRGLREEFRQLVELIEPAEPEAGGSAPRRNPYFARLGRSAVEVAAQARAQIVFVGSLTTALVAAAASPRRVRWKDFFRVAEEAGVGAVPIIALVGFLLGLILSFQSAVSMQRFGAEIFVADLLGISMFRELGPLMAAILLTARSGSAFAAELGTMKVNEEVDALTTMGLEPVRFLVVPRVLAGVAVVPVLTMLMTFFGLVGGVVVMMSLGYPPVTFFHRVADATSIGDMVGGLVKAHVFGVIVAAVGCLRGLQTRTGAGAVGSSATSAVVSGIVLIAVVDGIFAVIYYLLGV
jgi:phospholipid/cholesterol/gamma-HCH transport system permease protein